MLYRKKTFISR